MTEVDAQTGEVMDATTEVELVPLDLANLSEEQLHALFPSPVQVAGALLMARSRIARAPAVLKTLSKAVKSAKREAFIARGRAYTAAREAGFNISDARAYAAIDDKVIAAEQLVDDAELHLEYGRDTRKSLTTDIDILRSLNANFRAEHS